MNAINIPGLKPLVGGNLLDHFSPADQGLRRMEWLMHELFHVGMGMSTLGVFQKRLAHSLQLLLFSLDGDLVLHVPSWRLAGNSVLERILPKAASLLKALYGESLIADETIATGATLANLRMFHLAGRLTESQYRALVASVRRNTDPHVWHFCRLLEGCRWFTFANPEIASFAGVYSLLLGVGQYAFNPPVKTLQEWWETGQTAGGTRERLEFAFQRLAEARDRNLDEVAAMLTDVGVLAFGSPDASEAGFNGLQKLLQAASVVEDEPDPFSEMGKALGVEKEDLPFKHPVGRAVFYLLAGYAPTSPDEAASIMLGASGQLLAPFAALDLIVPLIIETQGGYRCEYMARVPIGRLVSRMRQAGIVPQELWERALRGEDLAIGMGRVTVMPATEEIKLLYDLESIMEQLLRGRLECLCGPSCSRTGGCACERLLSRVYRYVQTDHGRRLRAIPCLG